MSEEITGKVLFSSGQYDLALSKFKTLIQRDNKVGRYYYYLGNCQLMLQNFGEAVESYSKALELNIERDYLLEIYNNRSYASRMLGDVIGAEVDRLGALTQKLVNAKMDTELNFYLQFTNGKHLGIANFFVNEKFGAYPPLMTYLSTLKPFDRCVILEVIHNKNLYHTYDIIIDKLMLAYCKDGNKSAAESILKIYQQNGTRQEMFDHLVYTQQTVGIAPFRSDAERIEYFNDYETRTSNPLDVEFLKLLKSFVANQ